MDFKERVPFGRTGLMVSRIGLASGYGVPAAAIEKAFHATETSCVSFWPGRCSGPSVLRAM
jgi:hypothetical protein